VAIETLADPGYIIRCMILDCMKQHLRDNGCEAEVIYLTHGMEVLLNQHHRLENINKRVPLRERKELLGLEIVFDQPDFKLE
jgi:hypothetical protein